MSLITQIIEADYTDLWKAKTLVTERIIACCYRVHSELGPGFNEKNISFCA